MTFVEKICRALNDAGVRFAVIGGYARRMEDAVALEKLP